MRLGRRAGLALVVITGACVTDLSVGPRVVASLAITPDAPAIVVGATQQLLAIARDSNGVPFVGLATTWSSSAPLIVAITPTGLVEGMGIGTATITATSAGQTATTDVTVTPAPVIGLSRTSVPVAGTPGAPDPAAETVTITNTGGGTLDDLQLGTVVYGAGASGWLDAALDQASAPATLTLTATTGALAVGSYTATVPVTSASASNSPQHVTVTFTVAAGAAAAIAVSAGDGQTAAVGSAVAIPPSVIVRDAFNNPVAGVQVTFAVATGGGTLTGTNPATTNASGVASIGWTLGNTLGANSLTASAAGLTGSPVTFNATATAGPPSQIAVNAGDGQTATVNGAVTVPPDVLVTDALGNPVSGVAVTFAVASGGGNVSVPNQTTDASGIAQVGGWVLGQTAGSNSLTASAPGLTGSPVTFTATGTAGPAALLAKNAGDNQNATVNTAVATAPRVIVTDAFGNPIAGVAVTFAVTSGGGSTSGSNPATTDASGFAPIGWTLGITAGANTLSASAAGLGSVSFSATGTAGAATEIVKTAGDAQSAQVATAVAIPPRVQVRDQFGNGVSGVSVTFAITSGGGSLSGTNPAPTDAAGFAQIGWTLGNAIGSNSLTAAAGALTGSPLTFTATATAGGATQIAVSAGNGQTATVNTAVTTPPRVLVTDALGNPVSGVAVTFAVATGLGSVGGASQVTNASGLAQVGAWTLGTAAGNNNNTLTATASGLSGSPVTFTASATAGAATQIALSAGDGQSATVNTAVATPPRVIVRDAFNNPVAGVSVTFAVTGGGGSLTGTNPATTNASGFAQIGWTLGTSAGGNTLSAAATGLTGSPVTFTATGSAGIATQIAIQAGNGQSAAVATAVAVDPAVLVRDAFNNPVSGINVTFTVTGGSGSIVPVAPATLATNASGIATLTSWTLGNTAGTNNNTLSAASAGLVGSPLTFTASATAGGASQIALSAGNNQTAAVNTAVGTAPQVVVRDALNNPVAGVSVTFAVTGGGGSLTGPNPATTDASGFAQIGWTLGTTAGTNNNTLTATSTGLTGSPVTFTASASAGAATQIAASTGNGQTAVVNTAVAIPPRVLVRDAFNNPVAGVAVTFAVTAGGGSVTGANPATTDASGFASIGWTLGTVAGASNNTLNATSVGLTGSPVTFTASAAAGAPSASQSLVAATSPIAASSGASQSAITVTVRDAQGNPISGVTVTLAASGAGNTLTQPGSLTNASGVATGTLSSTFAESKTISATVNGAVSITQTAIVVVDPAAISAVQSTVAAAPGTIAASSGGTTSTITVTVRDQFDNPISGVTVALAATGTVNTLTQPASVTNALGVATGGLSSTFAELKTVAATAGATPVNQTASVTVTNASAQSIVLSAGDGQSATVNTAVATAPRVLVRDAFNNPVPGVSVTFAVTAGAGSLTGTNPATTDASGFTQIGWTLGTTAGTNNNTLTATSGGLSGSPVTFTASATAGAATQIAVQAGNGQSATVATAVAIDPAVLVRDAFNNPVGGVDVTFSVTGGGGSIVPASPATIATDASGIATLASWTLGNTAGANNNTLSAAATGLTGSPLTFTASGTAGAADSLVKDAATDGQVAQVNSAVPTPPRARVQDQFGNGVPGVSVTFAVAGGGGVVVPTTSIVTDVAGYAQVTSWTLGGAAGANSLTATSGVLNGSPLTFTATAIAGNATTIALAAGNSQTDTVGATLAVYQVLVTDAGSNPVAGVPVAWAVTLGGGTISPPNSSTDINGIATATRTLSQTVGTHNATASVGGLTGSPVPFTATATHGTATQIAVSAGNGQTATAGTAVATAPRVVVRDGFGNAVPGISVTFAVTGGGGSLSGTNPATTDASGFTQIGWTLGNTAGANSLTATSAGLTGSPVTFTATGVAGPATQIAVSAGNGQSATVGTAVATPPRVIVRDALNNPVVGVAVTFAVTGGGGSLTGTNPVATDASGFAQIAWTLGTVAGANTLTASSAGLTGSPVTFTATGTAGAATQIALSVGNNQSATVNTAVAVPPRVIVRDGLNNPVAGVSVTFAVTGGAGSLTGTNPATTDASGFAQIGWTLGTVAGTNNNTLTATSGVLAGSPVTFTASATTGAASQITLSAGDAQTATVNTAVATAPRVLVRDAFNNPVQGTSVTFAVTGGGGSLTGTNPATTDANGFAQIGWTLGTGAGTSNNTLTATSAGLAGSPVTFTASATAGAATQIAVSAGNNQTATVNTAVATLPRVAVSDAFGNPVAGVAVTFAVTGGGGSVFGANPVPTDASGLAQIGWTLGTTAGTGNNTLTATSGSLTGSPLTFTATAAAGAPSASQSTVAAGSPITASSGSSQSTVTVTVRDQFTNPVSGATVTLAATGGGNTLTQPAGATNASGVATGTLSSTVAQSQTVSATVNPGAVAITQTATVVVNPAAVSAATSTVAAATATIVPCAASCVPGSTASTITVTARDAFNNILAGSSVALASSGSGNTFAPSGSGTTNGSGVFAADFSSTVGEAKTISATIDGVGITQTAAVTVSAPTPASIELNAGNNQTAVVNTAVSTGPTVLVRDQFGNPIAGASVTFAVTGGGGSLTGTNPATTNGSGLAQIGWTLGTTAGSGNNTLTATSGVLAGSPVTFTASATAGAATQLTKNAGDGQSATVNTAVATPPQVLVQDAFGNVVAGAAVTFAVTGGGGSLSGTNPVATDASGLAQIGWFLGTTSGGNTLQASVSGTTPVTFNATGTAGAATQIAIQAGNGQTATVNTAVAVDPAALVRDAFNNPVSGERVTFTVTGGGGSTVPVSGNFVVTNASGIAALTSWTLGTSAGTNNNTLNATATGLTGSPLTFTASATAGAATQIALSAGNAQSSTVSSPVAIDPAVLVRDAFSNPVSGVLVTFTVTGGGGSTVPASGSTVATNASGIAAVTSWTLGTTAGINNNTLSATATGLSGSPVIFTASATAGAPSASQSSVSTTSPILACQVSCSTAVVRSTITVTVRDAFNNPIGGATVTLASSGSNNTIGQPGSVTNSSGQTTGTLSSFTAQSKTITATVNGSVVVTQTGTVVVNPDAVNAATSTVTRATATISACSLSCVAGSTASTITVTARDQFNNTVPSVPVTTASSGANNAFVPTSGSTNASGVYTTNFNSTQAAAKTITATANGVGISQTAAVTVVAATASSIAVSGGTGQTARVGTALPTSASFVVRDAFSNPVVSQTVTYSVTLGGGSPSAGSSLTNASGVASIGWTVGGTSTEGATGLMPQTLQATTAGAGSTTISANSRYHYVDVSAIIQTPTCTGCHGAVFTHAGLVAVGGATLGICAGQTRVVAGNELSGVLYRKTANSPPCGGVMPPSTSGLSAAQLKIIRAWIRNGALNN